MASFVAMFLWARIQTSSSIHIRRSPSSHSSIASVILLIVNPSSSSSSSGDCSFTPFPGLHISGHRENSRVCFFQSMVGLCAYTNHILEISRPFLVGLLQMKLVLHALV